MRTHVAMKPELSIRFAQYSGLECNWHEGAFRKTAGYNLSACHLKDIMNASMSMFKEKTMKHGIKIGMEIEPDADIEIEADERKLKQIMFNLLSNAVKFTPNGGRVRIASRKISDRGTGLVPAHGQEGTLQGLPLRVGDFIEISVSDTGIGIKPEDIPKLFNEFTQLESDYAKTVEGTGIGLALSKKLVELGGTIWVDSEFGKGSTFTFAIPAKQSFKEA